MPAAANCIWPARGSVIFDFVLVRAVINLVVLFGACIGLQRGLHRLPGADHDLVLLIGFPAIAALMLVLYWLLVRLMERRRAQELAFAPSLAGVILGAFLFCAVYVALWGIGVAHWSGIALDSKILVPFAVALGAPFGEELAFRGNGPGNRFRRSGASRVREYFFTPVVVDSLKG